jgi:hypothetical protein
MGQALDNSKFTKEALAAIIAEEDFNINIRR